LGGGNSVMNVGGGAYAAMVAKNTQNYQAPSQHYNNVQ